MGISLSVTYRGSSPGRGAMFSLLPERFLNQRRNYVTFYPHPSRRP